LVVEDNETNQQIATEMLQCVGFEVDVAPDGQIGVDLVLARHVQRSPYDLVLMDMQMPVMDGVTATQLIRKTLASSEVPIVAMTANAMPVDHARCLAAGMDDFVSKPIGIESLYGALLKWIKPRHRSGVAAAEQERPAY
jgi:two-component system, sensor histidine kinase and response regulator